jgi:hypothetical protein
MITRDDNALTDPDARAAEWTGIGEAGASADHGLLATLSSRVHCRAPMQPVDPEELSVRQPVHVDGNSAPRPGKVPVPAEVATYRCACGFTIDAPSLAWGYAAAG